MKPATVFVLDNGMKWILAENPEASAVAFSLWARVGVCDEDPRMRGLAHFMEHMMFRGSENIPPEGHSRTIARLGGECNAYTSSDGTVFHETLPPDALDEAFRLEADRFRRLRLQEDLVKTEKKVVFEEFRHLENQPLSRAWRILLENILAPHPYAVDPLGRREDLEKMTLEDLAAFRQRCYRPSLIFGVISGNFDSARARTLARALFGDWRPEGPEVPLPRPAPFRPAQGHREEKLSVEVPMAVRIHRLGSAAEEDLPALRILQAYLGRGESSPLREELVRNQEIFVDAGAMLWPQTHGGLFGLYGTFLDPGKMEKARGNLQDFCDSFAASGPEPRRLDSLVKKFRHDRAYDGYSATRRMEGLGEAELVGGGFERYERELEDLASVDAPRIKKLVEKLFRAEDTLTVDLLPGGGMPVSGRP